MIHRHYLAKGERVALSRMEEGDQPYFQKWLAGSAELRRLIADSTIPTMEDQMRWFARSKKSDRLYASVVAVDVEELIGNVGLVDIDTNAGTAEFRITIGNESYWGKGYGMEATQLFLRYAFEAMKLRNIRLRVLRSNERAASMYRKLNFMEESMRRKDDGEVEVLMSVSSDTFK